MLDTPYTADTYQETDIFAWANNLQQHKDSLRIELFMLSKKNIIYRVKLQPELQDTLPKLFIDDIIHFINEGANEGLVVRAYEDGVAEQKVLQKVPLYKVEQALEMMGWFTAQASEVEQFIEQEHDIKRMKGIVAACTHPSMPEPFYVVKHLAGSQVMKAGRSWMIRDAVCRTFDAEAALTVTQDNHLLITGHDIYVFKESKLTQLFAYNAKTHSIAERKIAEIAARLSMTLQDDIDLYKLAKSHKGIIKKLQTLELADYTQQALLDHADELGLDLMADESGSIIIMDGKDLVKVINLLNDDYVESNLTGMRYEIRAKRVLRPDEDDEAAQE